MTDGPLENLITVLEALRADAGGDVKTRGILRAIDLDTPEGEDLLEEVGVPAAPVEIPPAVPFERLTQPIGVSAIDCGTCALGESESAIHFALRSAIYSHHTDGRRSVQMLRSGIISVALQALPETLQALGASMGQEDFYVTQSAPDGPLEAKSGVVGSSVRIVDRFRSWWENQTRLSAIQTAPPGSLILLDGSLTINTRDVPSVFLQSLIDHARARDLSVVALSKKSDLSVGGKSVKFMLDDVIGAAHRPLHGLLEADGRAGRILGRTHVVRLTEGGLVFRADTVAAPGQTDNQTLNVLASLPSICGYPRALSYSHAFSTFSSPVRVSLRARVCATKKLVYDEKPLHAAFSGLGGGRYK